MLVDWFVVSKGQWDLGERAPLRSSMLISWLIGFIAYQLVNPGTVAGWSDLWFEVRDAIGLMPPDWLAASWSSFVIAAGATLVLGLISRQGASAGPQRVRATGHE